MRNRTDKEAIERELNALIYSRSDVFYTGKKAHATALARALAENRLSIWNRWRTRNKDLVSTLRCINLARRDLRKVYFRHTNLAYANLYRADLENAKMEGSRLVGADLVQANIAENEKSLNTAKQIIVSTPQHLNSSFHFGI